MRHNNKLQRPKDIKQMMEAVEIIGRYERFLNDYIIHRYQKRLARVKFAKKPNFGDSLPHAITGPIRTLCKMVDDYCETLNLLWRADVIQNKNSIATGKRAPTKEEFRLAITNVIGACKPIFAVEEDTG